MILKKSSNFTAGKNNIKNMKAKFLLSILLTVSAVFAAAQNKIMFPAGIDGKCGFIDENGNWIVSPQYDEVNDFFWDDMIEVKNNGKWGYVNLTDQTVITPQFDEVRFFEDNGTACVKKDGKWLFIDKTGKTVRKTEIEEIEFQYDRPSRAMTNGKWGYVDTNLNFIIEPKYEDAGIFYNNRAFVKLSGKYGYIDTLGKIVIEPQFEEPGDFPYNWAAVKYNGKFGFINPEGKFVIEPKYEEIKGFMGEDSAAVIVKFGGKYGLIDKTGKTITEPQYDEVDNYPSTGIAIVRQNDKYCVIDKTGKISKISTMYPLIEYFDSGIDEKWQKDMAAYYGLAAARKKHKYGYIDSTGNFVIKPKFDYASDFLGDNFAKIIYKGKQGWINKKTKVFVFNPHYEGVIISRDIIFVKLSGKWGIVDENGKFTVEPKFDWVVSRYLSGSFF